MSILTFSDIITNTMTYYYEMGFAHYFKAYS